MMMTPLTILDMMLVRMIMRLEVVVVIVADEAEDKLVLVGE